MASVKKFTHAAALNQIRHNNREIKNNSNEDIDPERKKYNLNLTPERYKEGPNGELIKLSEWEYYQQRKEELYCYNRADVKTLCGWIVTAPKEVADEDLRDFFEKTALFLENRYGLNNTISVVVHQDEGVVQKIRDENGNVVEKKIIYGRAHLHFLFTPAAPDNNPKHVQTEKINAHDVLTRADLRSFHSDLAEATGCPYVINGKTKAQGGNRTVSYLKLHEKNREIERLEHELARTKERVKELERQLNRQVELKTDRWSSDRNVERTYERW